MRSARSLQLRRWWRKYLEQLPSVAGSLTTAAILFLGAVIFQPAIRQLFTQPARSYPISCSADPIAVDQKNERATASFFIVNRSERALTADDLQSSLTTALDRDVGPSGPAIRLRFGPYDGRFVAVRPDTQFNGDKGKLHITEATSQQITIGIERIEAAAILKVDIDWHQSPPPEEFTRDTKGALPFDDRLYERACYSA